MRYYTAILFLAVLLSSGSVSMMAKHYPEDRCNRGWYDARHGDDDNHHHKRKHHKKQQKRRHGHRHDNGNHYGHNLKYMVGRAARGGRNILVWQAGPDTYVVKYYRSGIQNLYPRIGRYGSVVRLVPDGPGTWRPADRRGYVYRSEGPNLRLYIDGNPQSTWPLIPSLEINIPFNR